MSVISQIQAVDIREFVQELAEAPEDLFQKDRSRQELNPLHGSTETIFIRGIAELPSRYQGREFYLSQEASNAQHFPRLLGFLYRFAAERQAELRRVAIVRLKPRSDVPLHVDSEPWLAKQDRFHLVLHTLGGDQLTCDGVTADLKPGELWWFDNKRPHAAINRSDDWRVHVIFDLEPWSELPAIFETPQQKTRLQLLLREHCLIAKPQPRFNFRPLYEDAESVRIITHLFWRRFQGPCELVAVEPGSYPLLEAVLRDAPAGGCKGYNGLRALPAETGRLVMVGLFDSGAKLPDRVSDQFLLLDTAPRKPAVRVHGLFTLLDFEIVPSSVK